MEEEQPKWLALKRLQTEKGFSQEALIADTKASWNLAREMIWRSINPKLFSVQFHLSSLLEQGICIKVCGNFKASIDYLGVGGYTNPESVKLVKDETCEVKFRNMEIRIGEVQEIPITLPSGFVGQFIRVMVKLDDNEKLTRFFSFIRGD